MKDYLSIEKGISEIIHKLNKLKKTAKDVCINISFNKKRGKPKRKTRTNKLVSKGNQYSNVYKSPSNVSFNLEPANKMNNTNKRNKTNNKTNRINNNSINKTNESIESSESGSIESTKSNPLMSLFESGTETKQ
jgi:hypothetical protein